MDIIFREVDIPNRKKEGGLRCRLENFFLEKSSVCTRQSEGGPTTFIFVWEFIDLAGYIIVMPMDFNVTSRRLTLADTSCYVFDIMTQSSATNN